MSVINDKTFGTVKAIWPGLWCLAQIYRLAINIRKTAYSFGILKTRCLNVPVICVGNITVGGTGKTPLALMLAKYLVVMGRRPAVLSRGYKRQKTKNSATVLQCYGATVNRSNNPGIESKHRDVLVVSDGKTIKTGWREAGDEPYLLAQRLLSVNVPVIVGIERHKAGLAAKELDVDCLVLDDGFQHLGLHRDLNIVAIDATNPFGNGCLLPAGPLRELPQALKRAGLIALTKCALVNHERLQEIHKLIKRYARGIPVIETSYITTFNEYPVKKSLPESYFSGRKIVALSGLARPYPFEIMLSNLGAKEVIPLRYSDHHPYSLSDLRQVEELAHKHEAVIVTTEKDAVRLPADFQCVVAEIEVDILKGKTEWRENISAIF